MMNVQSSPKAGEGSWLWLVKIVSGALVIVLLLIHFLVNHFLAPEGLLSHADVVAYYQNPVVMIMEALFLIFVVSHSLTGLRGIILDMNPSSGTMRILDTLMVIVGVVSVVYGVWLLTAVAAWGAAG